MSYTHTTFGALKTAFANRLGDTSGVYWLNGADSGTTAELGLYIKEAMRTWGLLTGYWRDSGTFNTVAGTALYDISTLTNTSSTPLLSYTVTDKDLSYLIQYHLLEPSTGSTWTGSEQFTLADVTGALQKRRDQLLIETGAVTSLFTQVLGAGSQTVDLPDTTLQIRRLGWTGAVSGVSWPLYPEDIDNQRNYGDSYLITQGIPQTYSSSSVQPLRYVLAPPSNEPGTLSVLCNQSGATLTAAGVALGIPDDMAPIVKWGALADMLGKEGPAQDLTRSYFCERRWKLGIALAKINQTVVNAQINGVSLSPEAISRIDQYMPNWQSTQGTPTLIGNLRNYVALATCPDGVYSVLLDVVTKAVIPTLDTDFIQIGREYLDPILDYAEHLAAFKCGGMEFRHTLRAAENFFNAALAYNQRLSAQHPNIVELIKQSTLDDYVLPRQKPTQDAPLQQVAQISEQSAQIKQLYGGAGV